MHNFEKVSASVAMAYTNRSRFGVFVVVFAVVFAVVSRQLTFQALAREPPTPTEPLIEISRRTN